MYCADHDEFFGIAEDHVDTDTNMIGTDEEDYIRLELRPKVFQHLSAYEITHTNIADQFGNPVSVILKEIQLPPKAKKISFLINDLLITNFQIFDIDDTIMSVNIPLYLINQRLTVLTNPTTTCLTVLLKIHNADLRTDMLVPRSFKLIDKPAVAFEGRVHIGKYDVDIRPWEDPSISDLSNDFGGWSL